MWLGLTPVYMLWNLTNIHTGWGEKNVTLCFHKYKSRIPKVHLSHGHITVTNKCYRIWFILSKKNLTFDTGFYNNCNFKMIKSKRSLQGIVWVVKAKKSRVDIAVSYKSADYYRKSNAICDHTVLHATQQWWLSHFCGGNMTGVL